MLNYELRKEEDKSINIYVVDIGREFVLTFHKKFKSHGIKTFNVKDATMERLLNKDFAFTITPTALHIQFNASFYVKLNGKYKTITEMVSYKCEECFPSFEDTIRELTELTEDCILETSLKEHHTESELQEKKRMLELVRFVNNQIMNLTATVKELKEKEKQKEEDNDFRYDYTYEYSYLY
jgi:hypothetical protein